MAKLTHFICIGRNFKPNPPHAHAIGLKLYVGVSLQTYTGDCKTPTPVWEVADPEGFPLIEAMLPNEIEKVVKLCGSDEPPATGMYIGYGFTDRTDQAYPLSETAEWLVSRFKGWVDLQ